MRASEDTTLLLVQARRGDPSAADRLMPLVYDELRRLAASSLRRERRNHTLEPTALVHEAYLRLIGQRNTDWRDRTHFMAIAAEIIRRVLGDHARRRLARKRGGDWKRLTLHATAMADATALDMVELDDALARLEQLHERQARVVKLRFFAGLTGDEIADVLAVARSTVVDDWTAAKAWLLSELGGNTLE